MKNAQQYAIGIDIGGSHITSALVDLKSRTLVDNTLQRQRVNCHGSVEEIIDSWSDSICLTFGNKNLQGQKIGIAMPGPFDYSNGISLMKDNDKYASLYAFNVKALLSDKLNTRKENISFINDAAAFLKGELFAGAAIGYKRAIGLTLGTGLGTTKFDGLHVEDANLWCSPFLGGIAEDYLSTRWFIKAYKELSGKEVNGVKELSATYQTDVFIPIIFRQFATNLASFLEGFIEVEKPEIVVIGGNIMNNENLFLPEVKEHLKTKGIDIPIVRAKLGEDAAILGACALL